MGTKKEIVLRRMMAVLLVLTVLIPANLNLYAFGDQDLSLCKHHPTHTEKCGYAPGQKGTACSHIHSEACTSETVCIHVHDESCGGLPEGTVTPSQEETTPPEENETVSESGEPGNDSGLGAEIDSNKEKDTEMEAGSEEVAMFAYNHACNHVCSVESGCVTYTCGHGTEGPHDETCGYAPGTADIPCKYVCPICDEGVISENSGVEINLPEEDSAAVRHSNMINLLEGVSVSASGADSTAINTDVDTNVDTDINTDVDMNVDTDITVSIYAVLSTKTNQPAEVQNDILTMEEDTSYLVTYVAKNQDGVMVAAAEREISAELPEVEKLAPMIAKDEDENIEVTVELPKGGNDQENILTGYTLHVDKVVSETETGSVPQAIEQYVGKTNVPTQGYEIYFTKDGQEGQRIMLSQLLNTLGTCVSAEITVEYIKAEARIHGPVGQRRLMILTEDGGRVQEYSTLNVDLDDGNPEYYNRFTFASNSDGPYYFANKKLFEGYISEFKMVSQADGSEPFDQTGNKTTDGMIDTPGNDSGEHNGVVRTQDVLKYTVMPVFSQRYPTATKDKATIHFEMTIDADPLTAAFDTDQFLWAGKDYKIEYLDVSGQVVMIQKEGKYLLKDQDGSFTREVHLNDMFEGSIREYKEKENIPQITKQRITASYELIAGKDNSNVISGNQTFSAGVRVLNGKNGKILNPNFRMWFDGNEDNYGPESEEAGVFAPAQVCNTNFLTADAVTISAGARYNVQLKKNTDFSYKNWFDFSSGGLVCEEDRAELERLAALKENYGKANPAEFTDNGNALDNLTKEKFQNYRYGRMTGYGLTLQLYNQTDGTSTAASKGKKGLELPKGEITFDLNLKTDQTDDEHTPILWDYNENIPANNSYNVKYDDKQLSTPNDGKGNGDRTIYWNDEQRSPYGKGAGPSNYKSYHDGCYYGGDWSMTGYTSKNVSYDGNARPTTVIGTGEDTTYHFKVSGYDFDFDKGWFPVKDAGNSGEINLYKEQAACFSAGYIQVLNVFPRYQDEAVTDLHTKVEVSNLNVTSWSNQTVKNQEGAWGDNLKDDKITLYAVGGATKGNAFSKYAPNMDMGIGTNYLGTDYWNTSYDCNAYAGELIAIKGYGLFNASGDHRIRAMNLLQLFDSRALKIEIKESDGQKIKYSLDGNKSSDATKIKFLYAADPAYPEGYDTNKPGVVSHMNLVREEQLVYSEKLNDDGTVSVKIGSQTKNLPCIGVLMEVRGCDIGGGYYEIMSIPVRINGEDSDLISKTVCTVNAFNGWTEEGAMMKNGQPVSWKDGVWNVDQKKNILEGYEPIQWVDTSGHGNGIYVYNDDVKGYAKTEYREDGNVQEDTHKGGVVYGNSLLILSYKAHVKLDVVRNDGVAGNNYDMNAGQNKVDYVVNNISTDVYSSTQPSAERARTNLTVKIDLDDDNKANDRVKIAMGSFVMGGKTITTDPENPTEIPYKVNGETYELKVCASPSTDGQSVTFTIKDAPVGVKLPDIHFTGLLNTESSLKNNDKIRATAYIKGDGDCRAYNNVNGNFSQVTIGIIRGSGTFLSKAVDKELMELGDTITYTVSYSNTATTPIGKMYFYDLMPYNGDIRGSDFTGGLEIRDFGATLSKSDETQDDKGFTADVTVYYSKTEQARLRPALEKMFTEKDTEGIEGMLQGKDSEASFRILGTIDKDTGEFKRDSSITDEELSSLIINTKCLFVKVENLSGNRTISLNMKVHSMNNQAADIYGNVAHSLVADGDSSQLSSNQVQTTVVARDISGKVWFDSNYNGVQDTDEPAISDVECTLFKWNEDESKYEACTQNVLKEPIGEENTDASGEYSFDKLAAGQYVVAFKTPERDVYQGVTGYQVSGGGFDKNNDGVAVTQDQFPGIDRNTYPYAIQYQVGRPSMTLHTPEEMVAQNLSLDRYRERVTHQDLGLTIERYELPESGGSGIWPYYAAGGALIALGALAYLIKYRKRILEKNKS